MTITIDTLFQLAVEGSEDLSSAMVLHDAWIEAGLEQPPIGHLLVGVDLGEPAPRAARARVAWRARRKRDLAKVSSEVSRWSGTTTWARAVLAYLIFGGWAPKARRLDRGLESTRSPWPIIRAHFSRRRRWLKELADESWTVHTVARGFAGVATIAQND